MCNRPLHCWRIDDIQQWGIWVRFATILWAKNADINPYKLKHVSNKVKSFSMKITILSVKWISSCFHKFSLLDIVYKKTYPLYKLCSHRGPLPIQIHIFSHLPRDSPAQRSTCPGRPLCKTHPTRARGPGFESDGVEFSADEADASWLQVVCCWTKWFCIGLDSLISEMWYKLALFWERWALNLLLLLYSLVFIYKSNDGARSRCTQFYIVTGIARVGATWKLSTFEMNCYFGLSELCVGSLKQLAECTPLRFRLSIVYRQS